MGEVIPFTHQETISGGQLAQAINQDIENSNSVTSQLGTTVSQLAILFPALFMSETDPAKMVQMLEETRSDISEAKSLRPLIEQVQLEGTNTSQTPLYEVKQAA